MTDINRTKKSITSSSLFQPDGTYQVFDVKQHRVNSSLPALDTLCYNMVMSDQGNFVDLWNYFIDTHLAPLPYHASEKLLSSMWRAVLLDKNLTPWYRIWLLGFSSIIRLAAHKSKANLPIIKFFRLNMLSLDLGLRDSRHLAAIHFMEPASSTTTHIVYHDRYRRVEFVWPALDHDNYAPMFKHYNIDWSHIKSLSQVEFFASFPRNANWQSAELNFSDRSHVSSHFYKVPTSEQSRLPMDVAYYQFKQLLLLPSPSIWSTTTSFLIKPVPLHDTSSFTNYIARNTDVTNLSNTSSSFTHNRSYQLRGETIQSILPLERRDRKSPRFAQAAGLSAITGYTVSLPTEAAAGQINTMKGLHSLHGFDAYHSAMFPHDMRIEMFYLGSLASFDGRATIRSYKGTNDEKILTTERFIAKKLTRGMRAPSLMAQIQFSLDWVYYDISTDALRFRVYPHRPGGYPNLVVMNDLVFDPYDAAQHSNSNNPGSNYDAYELLRPRRYGKAMRYAVASLTQFLKDAHLFTAHYKELYLPNDVNPIIPWTQTPNLTETSATEEVTPVSTLFVSEMRREFAPAGFYTSSPGLLNLPTIVPLR